VSETISLRWAAVDHASLLTAAVDVAKADGLGYLAKLLSTPAGTIPDNEPPPRLRSGPSVLPSLLDRLSQGVIDVDFPISGGYILHLYHFHHPWTHRGYAGSCLSGARVSEGLFTDALQLWRTGQRGEAVYELGRACHSLIDCFVPHHAAGVAGCGHGQYEAWLAQDQRWRQWAPQAGGRYQWQATYRGDDERRPHRLDWRTPSHWVDLAAHEAWPWFRDHLNGCAAGLGRPRSDVSPFFPEAAATLVPATVRYLAGFLHLFFVKAGATEAAATPGATEAAATPGATEAAGGEGSP
jgi:hypothetical protein